MTGDDDHTPQRFVDELYRDLDEGWLTLFTLDRATGRRATTWVSAEAPTDLLEHLDPHLCCWFGVATRTQRLDGGRRGGANDCAAIPALWVDLDVAGPNHAAVDLPPTLDDAQKLLACHPEPPTVVVATGGGLQAWWLLDEPATIDEYQAVAERWAHHWVAAGEMYGWHVDNTSDAARIMRLPGGVNTKTDPGVAVVVTEAAYERRYGLSDLIEACDPLPDPVAPSTAPSGPVAATADRWGVVRPGDDFNRRHNAPEILTTLGFTLARTDRNGDTHWVRPGKAPRDGTSATVYADDGHCTIWSDTCRSMWPALAVRRPYDPFGLWVATSHGGDWSAARRALAAEGYGDPSTPTDLAPLVVTEDEPARLNVRFTDELDDLPPRPPEIIRGLLRRGEMAVLGAPRALGKSWAVMGLSLLCAQGNGRLFDLPELEVVTPAKVLYLQGELDPWGSADRWRTLAGGPRPPRIAETFDRARINVYRRSISHPMEGGGSVRDDQLHASLDERLWRATEEHGTELLVIDPWAVFFGGNENSNDEVEAAVATLKSLMDAWVAILVVHHVSKATEFREPEDLWRGASRLADWASTRITMLPHYTAKQAKDRGLKRHEARAYADVHFLRRAAPVPDISVHRGADGWWRHWVPDDELTEPLAGEVAPRDIFRALQAEPGLSTNQLSDRLGHDRRTVRRALDQLQAGGVLEATDGAHGAKCWHVIGTVDNHFPKPSGGDHGERY